MDRQMQVRAMREMFQDSIRIWLREKNVNGEWAFLTDLVFTIVPPDSAESIEYKSILFPVEAAQQMMDELWNCGLRPSEGSGSAGAMRQAEDHLATLKKDNDRLYELLAVLVKREGPKEP